MLLGRTIYYYGQQRHENEKDDEKTKNLIVVDGEKEMKKGYKKQLWWKNEYIVGKIENYFRNKRDDKDPFKTYK